MIEHKVMNTHDYDTDVHDYSIETEKTNKGIKYKLTRSNDSNWGDDFKGTKCLSIINTGNGWIFPKIEGELDYAACAELMILINFINGYEKMPLYNGKIVSKETELINLIRI
jgi:hypothetical protein